MLPSLPPTVVVGGRILADRGLENSMLVRLSRNTLALPPLLILKVQKVVESQLGLTLIPRQCSATAEEPAQPYALLWVWLQVRRVWGWGGFCPLPGDLTPWRGWCGVEGVSWHPEVTVLGLGTTWLCNSGLASPGHPASSERAVIQHT